MTTNMFIVIPNPAAFLADGGEESAFGFGIAPVTRIVILSGASRRLLFLPKAGRDAEPKDLSLHTRSVIS